MPGNKIGFIGIGNMGSPMTANLLRAGFQVMVYDSNPEQVKRFTAEQQASAATSLAQLGSAVDVVITMLPTGRDVRKVMLEQEQGALAETLQPGSLLIDMSSSDPIGTQQLGAALDERGLRFIDAPVSGGVPGAINASLAIMIGSNDKAAIERARPILSAMGKRLFETGPLGSGHAMKALNNIVAGTGFIAIAEALIIGKTFGLEPAVIIDILNSSTGRSFNSEYTFVNHVLKQAYTSGFNLALLSKDVGIAAGLAKGLGLDAPVIDLASRRWQEAAQGLGPGKDFTEGYVYWESIIKPKPEN
ncbi:MAG: 2-hydroxy-3-oxopropionate reductase [Gammaproteobacteria bacterium RIFCSPLOWO2_12_FULL_52_10]|nr:MAG: 2-hydroxy-3-oxopropionate reductase [Gammaproteobacteria bacterium RIFCSPLOWO2_12_FULL_52_10]